VTHSDLMWAAPQEGLRYDLLAGVLGNGGKSRWDRSLKQSYSAVQTAMPNTNSFGPKPILLHHTDRSSATTAVVH
jgi:hypothetical protein